MPKLKNITVEEIAALLDQAFDLSGAVGRVVDHVRQGRVDDIAEPIRVAGGFLAVSRVLADLAHAALLRAALQEQKRELETMMRQRAGADHG